MICSSASGALAAACSCSFSCGAEVLPGFKDLVWFREIDSTHESFGCDGSVTAFCAAIGGSCPLGRVSLCVVFCSLSYAAHCRGVTRSAISSPASISAWRSSQLSCRFNHSCGLVRKYRANRSAVSALTPRWPLRIILTRFTGTPSAFDFSRSCRTTSVRICDFNVRWAVVGPAEADAPLRVDANAVLPGAVSGLPEALPADCSVARPVPVPVLEVEDVGVVVSFISYWRPQYPSSPACADLRDLRDLSDFYSVPVFSGIGSAPCGAVIGFDRSRRVLSAFAPPYLCRRREPAERSRYGEFAWVWVHSIL